MPKQGKDPFGSLIPRGLLRRLREERLLPKELEIVVAVTEQSDLKPPSWVLARAARIPQQEAEARVEQPGILERIGALLMFDSRMAAQPVMVRGKGDGGRTMLYTAGPVTVHLKVTHDGDLAALSGQILSDEQQAFEVALYRESDHKIVAQTNELGFFALQGLQPGVCTVVIKGASKEAVDIEIVDFSLAAE